MKGGAVDFLEKPASGADLERAIRAALAWDAERRAGEKARQLAAERISRLTAREREVVAAVVSGRRSAQVALLLGIGEQTVRVHRMHAMHKLGVSSVPELVHLWRQASM